MTEPKPVAVTVPLPELERVVCLAHCEADNFDIPEADREALRLIEQEIAQVKELGK